MIIVMIISNSSSGNGGRTPIAVPVAVTVAIKLVSIMLRPNNMNKKSKAHKNSRSISKTATILTHNLTTTKRITN